MRPSTHVLLCTIILLSGCASNRDVVGHGPFQKRKFRPGWHVDLGMGHRNVESRERPMDQILRLELRTVQPAEALAEPIASAKTVSVPFPAAGPKVPFHRSTSTLLPQWTASTSTEKEKIEPPDGPRRWNRMAIVSGIFLVLSFGVIAATGGGAILGYLLTFAFITGLIGLLLAIKHHERGKGIAIAAIAVPLALLALVVAALNGFM
ncbi:MAG: hypothetical protein IT225_08555 [Flavobacteriales bacterium]|nr:hypothetical protein [Flavobacteriales bacterium]